MGNVFTFNFNPSCVANLATKDFRKLIETGYTQDDFSADLWECGLIRGKFTTPDWVRSFQILSCKYKTWLILVIWYQGGSDGIGWLQLGDSARRQEEKSDDWKWQKVGTLKP